MKFVIIGSGFQAFVDYSCLTSSGDIEKDEAICLKNITKEYLNAMHIAEPFIIESAKQDDGSDGPRLIYYPKPGDHILIMTERQHSALQREQMFAIQRAQQQRGVR